MGTFPKFTHRLSTKVPDSMIERFHTNERSSKIVKHNETVYLTGQVGGTEGDIADQTKECLSRVENLLIVAGSSTKNMLQVES